MVLQWCGVGLSRIVLSVLVMSARLCAQNMCVCFHEAPLLIHTHSHARTHTRTHARTQHTHTHVRARACTHTTHTHARNTHAYNTHTRIHTRTHTTHAHNTRSHAHTCTRAHAHARTRAHARTARAGLRPGRLPAVLDADQGVPFVRELRRQPVSRGAAGVVLTNVFYECVTYECFMSVLRLKHCVWE